MGIGNSIKNGWRWLAGEPMLWDRPEPVSYRWTKEPERVKALKIRLEPVARDDENHLTWLRDRRTGQLWELRADDANEWRTEHLRPVNGMDRPARKLVLRGTQLAH